MSPTRSAQTLSALRSRLADGTWPIGTRLPGEHDLAAELGVGRNTVREALRTLSNAGLLRARRGDGTYVIATDELAAALQRRIDTEEAHRVLEVRGALEVESARLAATRATDEELAALRSLLQERDAAAHRRDDVAFLRGDLAWHAAIAAAARNPLLLDLYLSLDRASTYAREALTGTGTTGTDASTGATSAGSGTGAGPNGGPGTTSAPHEAPTPDAGGLVWADSAMHLEHTRLLEALEARDPSAAAQAATALIAASHAILDGGETSTPTDPRQEHPLP